MPLPRYVANEVDPELAAEEELERQEAKLCAAAGAPRAAPPATSTTNGHSAPAKTANGNAAAEVNGTTHQRTLSTSSSKGSLKESKAQRKKRSRGVSGSSIKKDGGRFDMGMESYQGYDDYSEDDDYNHYDTYADKKSSSTPTSVDDGISDDMSSLKRFSDSEDKSRKGLCLQYAIEAALEDQHENIESIILAITEIYDERERVSVFAQALDMLAEDSHGPCVLDGLYEYKMVHLAAKVLFEGFLSRDCVRDFIEKSSESSYGADLLKAALNLVDSTPREKLYVSISQKVPSLVDSLAAKFLDNVDDGAFIAKDLINANLPYFHSEFVSMVCQKAIVSMDMDLMYQANAFLKHLVDTKVVSPVSVRLGFARFIAGLEKIEIDLPAAASLATLLVSYAANDFVLIDEEIYMSCPKPKHFILKPDKSSKLSVMEGHGKQECNETNYFQMDDQTAY